MRSNCGNIGSEQKMSNIYKFASSTLFPARLQARSEACASPRKLGEAEELEVLLLEERDSVPDALREDRLEVRAECRVRVARGEERLRHIRERRARVPEDSRPLLDLLEEVLREQRRVTASR